MKILVLNCGSSSIKYRLLDMPSEQLLAWGLLERVGQEGSRLIHDVTGRSTLRLEQDVPDHESGLQLILDTLTHAQHGAIDSLRALDGIGHRVVHGGPRHSQSVKITGDVIDTLREFADLAPLHNPPNLAGIEACRKHMPGITQVAVFDTGIHQTVPPHAHTYALPKNLTEKYRLRRYGFHGIAIRWATRRAEELLHRPLNEMKVVTLMLGSGCTANAMAAGKSVDVSTGFTPLEGLVQSTRCGDIDAALVLWVMEREGWTPDQATEVLIRQSGWSGVSGLGPDLREIIVAAREGSTSAQLALDVFAYRCRKYVGAYAAAMGGIDALIFTGGVGEKSPLLRGRICAGLEFLGISLDMEKNQVVGDDRVISAADSKVTALVVAMNEELVIARDTQQIMEAKSS